MFPRTLFWRAIASYEEKNDPGFEEYIKREVITKIKHLVADESIKIATNDREDGAREYEAHLYIFTKPEMDEFVAEIQRRTRIQMPLVL